MSARHSDAPQRVVAAAAEMLATYGLNASSVREVAKRAQAPFGSTYHHFPGGKQQVLAEATTLAGAKVDALLDTCLQGAAPEGLHLFLAAWRERLIRSDFHVGCPVLAAAVEEPIDDAPDDARRAAAEVFARWEARLTEALSRGGRSPEQANGIATMIIASIEGAVAMSRATRDIGPFDRVAAQLVSLVADR
ncbi:TetR/AcrR family transcriptional regulator [Stenotrophomonas sp. PS02301]|uniref:TetR/AcrR family transcriptional regulator n=1 Tax=Stenotrophomonas sp. PS02301 TaxID=2991427 RepID=UPI00249AD252|nr:TetR/AcrR family transcriptional regulator [Stenotrophomonas sp. PS02301]